MQQIRESLGSRLKALDCLGVARCFGYRQVEQGEFVEPRAEDTQSLWQKMSVPGRATLISLPLLSGVAFWLMHDIRCGWVTTSTDPVNLLCLAKCFGKGVMTGLALDVVIYLLMTAVLLLSSRRTVPTQL